MTNSANLPIKYPWFLVNSETGGLQLFFTDNFLEKLARTVNLLLHFCTYCFLRGFVDCLSLYLGFYCNSRPLFSLRSEKAYSGSRQTSMMELFYKIAFRPLHGNHINSELEIYDIPGHFSIFQGHVLNYGFIPRFFRIFQDVVTIR